MAGLTLLLVLAAATVLLAPLAERINLPYPVVMLMFGLALAFVPKMPAPTVNAGGSCRSSCRHCSSPRRGARRGVSSWTIAGRSACSRSRWSG